MGARGNGNCLLHFTSSTSPALSKPHQVSVSSSEKEALYPHFLSPRSLFLHFPPLHPSLFLCNLLHVFHSFCPSFSPLLCFQIKRTPVCLLRLTLFVAKLDIIPVTKGAALRRLLDLFLDGAVLTGCCLTQFYLTDWAMAYFLLTCWLAVVFMESKNQKGNQFIASYCKGHHGYCQLVQLKRHMNIFLAT